MLVSVAQDILGTCQGKAVVTVSGTLSIAVSPVASEFQGIFPQRSMLTLAREENPKLEEAVFLTEDGVATLLQAIGLFEDYVDEEITRTE